MARSAVGFGRETREGEDKEAVSRIFTPEFRNRLDAIIPFQHLPEDVVASVVDKFISKLETQLQERNVTISLDGAARKWLVKHGYDKANGARPLARLIAEKIKKPLAEEVLFGKLAKGGEVCVTVAKDDTLTFRYPSTKERKKPLRDVKEDEFV